MGCFAELCAWQAKAIASEARSRLLRIRIFISVSFVVVESSELRFKTDDHVTITARIQDDTQSSGGGQFPASASIWAG